LSLALLATMGGLLLLAGCNPSTRYPTSMRYPLRQDVLVAGELKDQPTRLPSPGLLDESIKAALKKEESSKSYDPAKLTADERKALRMALTETFGTPAAPSVKVPLGARDAPLLSLKYDKGPPMPFNAETHLARGSELFRKHCMHCHGVAGDGRGPTGPWLHPHPRDYRQGQFKYVSSQDIGAGLGRRKPRLDDLRRTIQKGIDGTSMPAFGLLPDDEVEAILGYVLHLSIRGETEYRVISSVLDQGDNRKLSEDDLKGEVDKQAEYVVKAWALGNAKESLNDPPAYPEKFIVKADASKEEKEAAITELHNSIRRGQTLFNDVKGGICITCHFDYGRQSAYRYDAWGTLVRPRDLTAGTYRGGRRPLDLFWRIRSGIGPSGMPAFDPTKATIDGKPATEEAVWDLVNFVRAVPYPNMLPDDVREKVYGKGTVLPPGGKSKHHDKAE
jgi:mono/diheme cytochrome c family protein